MDLVKEREERGEEGGGRRYLAAFCETSFAIAFQFHVSLAANYS